MSDRELYIKLLELQIDSLRSVLSEFGSPDELSAYIQWTRAEAIANLLFSLKREE